MTSGPADISSPEAADAAVEAVYKRQQSGDLTFARQVYESVLRSHPRHARALFYLGMMEQRAGRFREAFQLIANSISIDRTDPRAHHEMGCLFLKAGETGRALQAFEAAVTAGSVDAQAHHNLGVCYDHLGRLDEAAARFEQAIRLDPSHAKAMASLFSLPEYKPSKELITNAQEVVRSSESEPGAAAKLHVALGKRADKQGDFDTAFEHFKMANGLAKKLKPDFQARGLEHFVDKLIAAFPTNTERQSSGKSAGILPIFIVGMPRSGTSLVEQVLASHPEVHGAGELQEIPKLITSFGPGYPEGFNDISSDRLMALRDRYLERLETLAPDGVTFITDKLPLNFMHLGLIARLLPEAHIIHCVRDPLDVGLSCFIEQFEMPQDFSSDFENFAAFYGQYKRLIEH